MTDTPRIALHRLAQQIAARLPKAEGEQVRDYVDSLIFRADVTFREYEPFPGDGPYPARLLDWIANVTDVRERAALIALAAKILFLDKRAVRSLYAEAYRLHIAPWLLEESLTLAQELSASYWTVARDALTQARVYSVTDSFHWDTFRSENEITGIPEPKVLGKSRTQIRNSLESTTFDLGRVVIVEDVVGSGDQVIRALKEVVARCQPRTKILFVALILVEDAELRLRAAFGDRVSVRIVSTVRKAFCIRDTAIKLPWAREHALVRAVVKRTSERVMRRLDARDDPPKSPFGYGGTGATLVLFRNTPNNTLPLIHHKAPNWNPLFRRIHHAGRD